MRHALLALTVSTLAVAALLIGPAARADDSPSASNRAEEPNAKGLGSHADPARAGAAQPVYPRRSGDSNDTAGEDATALMRPGETPPAPADGSK